MQAQNSAAAEVALQRVKGSEAEIRKIAVAVRGAGARHQQTIDGGHQAAEESGGRHDAESSSFGHF